MLNFAMFAFNSTVMMFDFFATLGSSVLILYFQCSRPKVASFRLV